MSDSKTDQVVEEFDWARKLHQSGMLEEAIAGYRAVAAKTHQNATVHHYLGMALLAHKATTEAIVHLQEAARYDPGNADIWNDLGVAAESADALDDAESAFQRCLAIREDLTEPRVGLAFIFLRQARARDALKVLEPIWRIGNTTAAALYARAWLEVLREAGNDSTSVDAALNAVDAAIAADDEELVAATHLACFSVAGSHDDEATQHRIVDQLDYLQPDSVAALTMRGRAALQLRNDYAETAEIFDRVLTIDPDNLEAQWLRCFLSFRHSYNTPDDLTTRREDYAARLSALRERLEFAGHDDLALAEQLIGTVGPYLLPYQGQVDRDLQCIWGELVADVMQARYPAPANNAERRGDDRIQVAFVSSYVYAHSNWKLRRGWIRHLDHSRFSVTIYSLGKYSDWLTEEMRDCCDAFHAFPGDFDGAIQQIRQQSPDIIVYPSIGLAGIITKFAALRLAPVQCTTWGHPVTSGLPTIDHFLSSDLMEPPKGDAHYTEKLVRLPGLSISYDAVPATTTEPDRPAFGLRPGAVVYLAVQSLQKYLPQFDRVFVEIAARVPDALFVFIEGKIPKVARLTRFRIETAFRRVGLDPDDHLLFLPSMDFERFQLLLRSADVFLDSIEWSGANTTLEALRWDLPVVTLPGRLMRGRHSSAILTFLGLEDGVARDIDDYVAIASDLGLNKDRRAAMREAISRAKPKLSEDKSAIVGLMEYFTAAAEMAAKQREKDLPLSEAPRRRQLEKSEDGLYYRQYATYEEYVAHQREKLRHLDLTQYDKDFHRELSDRLAKSGLVRRGDTVLCLGARLGSECRAFIDQGAVAIGIDLNPGH